MNVFIWILQGVLAAIFLFAGVMKATRPKSQLQSQMPWVEDFSPAVVTFIGTVEILAAIGLVLPAALDIAPILTPIAATGLCVQMVLAAATHARRKEPQAIVVNAVLFVIAAVIAWARFGPYSF
ncbi:MAG TPA: DoxX family protein [Kribbellaceae bacterium]|nr:DoxX family protein [Kribbellaceae bacterium]